MGRCAPQRLGFKELIECQYPQRSLTSASAPCSSQRHPPGAGTGASVGRLAEEAGPLNREQPGPVVHLDGSVGGGLGERAVQRAAGCSAFMISQPGRTGPAPAVL